MARPPSQRRLVAWAAGLLAVLTVSAVALPWIVRRLAPDARRADAARAGDGAVGGRAAGLPALGGAPPSPGVAPPAPEPRQPDGPTVEQIEAARRTQDDLIRAQEGWKRIETIAPREARRDAGGELVAPFQGFGLSVESTPPGAAVVVDGRDLGETPLVASVACRPGDPVTVRVERRPLRPQVRTVRCREDALVTVQVTLAR